MEVSLEVLTQKMKYSRWSEMSDWALFADDNDIRAIKSLADLMQSEVAE